MAPTFSPTSSNCWCRPCATATLSLWITFPPTRLRAWSRRSRRPEPHCAARLLTRPQPDRAGILEAQGGSAQGCGPHRDGGLETDRSSCQELGAGGVCELL